MTLDHALIEVLNETVEALSSLDSAKLHALEQRILALAKSDASYDEISIGLVLRKKEQLEIVLQNFQVNLDTLTRLHARNMRN